jgi:hypothetical protein
MSLDKKDLEMMAVSVPTTDFWELREEIDRLADMVERLETIVKALVTLYHEERVKNWELILKEMLRREERKVRRPFYERQRESYPEQEPEEWNDEF